jgi:hypothetical protein
MARALHAGACRDHAIVVWVVLWDLPAYPERYAARLATSGRTPSPYLLLADSLVLQPGFWSRVSGFCLPRGDLDRGPEQAIGTNCAAVCLDEASS